MATSSCSDLGRYNMIQATGPGHGSRTGRRIEYRYAPVSAASPLWSVSKAPGTHCTGDKSATLPVIRKGIAEPLETGLSLELPSPPACRPPLLAPPPSHSLVDSRWQPEPGLRQAALGLGINSGEVVGVWVGSREVRGVLATCRLPLCRQVEKPPRCA